MNYNLCVFSQKWHFGKENENSPYFARLHVCMSHSYTAKTSVIAWIVFLTFAVVCIIMIVCIE